MFLLSALVTVISPEADSLTKAKEYLRTDYERAAALAEDVLKHDSNNVDALWISSVAHTNLANLESDEQKRDDYFSTAEQRADRALQLDDDYAQTHYARAVVLGRRAENAGAREGVRLAREIKEHADKAIDLDPEHGGAWYINGMLLFRVANLSFAERMAANALFGGFPFDASNEKAVISLRNAIEYSPENIYYHIGLARALIEMGEEEEAEQVLATASELEDIGPEDEEHLETVNDMLADL